MVNKECELDAFCVFEKDVCDTCMVAPPLQHKLGTDLGLEIKDKLSKVATSIPY